MTDNTVSGKNQAEEKASRSRGIRRGGRRQERRRADDEDGEGEGGRPDEAGKGGRRQERRKLTTGAAVMCAGAEGKSRQLNRGWRGGRRQKLSRRIRGRRVGRPYPDRPWFAKAAGSIFADFVWPEPAYFDPKKRTNRQSNRKIAGHPADGRYRDAVLDRLIAWYAYQIKYCVLNLSCFG